MKNLTDWLGIFANAAQIISSLWTLAFGSITVVDLWRKRPPRWSRHLIAPIILLVLSSILAFIINGNILPGVRLTIQPTATIHPAISPTPTAHPAISPTPTMTAEQNIYNQATSGTLVLSDPLNQQDSNSWDESTTCAFVTGAYHASDEQADDFSVCTPNKQSDIVGDFAFQVQMTILRGDYGGISFRTNSTGTDYYAFTVDQAGQYSLVVYKDDNVIKTVSNGDSLAFKTDLNQPNLITVIARGSDFYLYINKQFIARGSDTSYRAGQIGLLAGSITHPTEVAFSDLNVW